MNRAALYARVSTDAQKEEGTIESQVAELKQQIAAAGHVLVKEYVDDGFRGAEMERPALEEMRVDAKAEVFDAIYFLDTDRLARDVAYQMVIVAELLKYGRRIIIKGKDYVNNPENKFALTVLGAVAELERAKIMERTRRGWLHRLRMGEMTSNGHRIFGYDYVRKTDTSAAALVINEEQAIVVRSVFQMFASGRFGLVTICRHLEERGIKTRMGHERWDNDRIKTMLKNETYTGTRYFNRITAAKNAKLEGQRVMRGKWIYRDRKDWIAVAVPVIVSRELFEKVQTRLRTHEERYCRPHTHYLLSGLIQCGVCGGKCSSSRGWHKVARPTGKISLYHQAAYRCIRRARENMHDRTKIERCRNSQISTHILEDKVFEMIRAVMLDPAALRSCVEGVGIQDDRGIARKLARVAVEIKKVEDERRRAAVEYAEERVAGKAYIAANRALDREDERLSREKAKLVAAIRSPKGNGFVDASIRKYCADANARYEACVDDDGKRQFLKEHVERVIYDHYDVAIIGRIPVQSTAGETKLPFRIEGVIDTRTVRVNAAKRAQATLKRSTERQSVAASRSLAVPVKTIRSGRPAIPGRSIPTVRLAA